MQKSAKKEVFSTLLEFGGSDRLDIAYDGSPKRSHHVAVVIGHA